MCVSSCFRYEQLFVTPWTVACQAPLPMGFSRQEYWSIFALQTENPFVWLKTTYSKVPLTDAPVFLNIFLRINSAKWFPWWLSSIESVALQDTQVQSLGWEDPW